jgi:hypothetical protein
MEAMRPEANHGLEVPWQARAAVPVLTAITILVTWWGLKDGAYFDGVFYPGAIAVYALLGVLLTSAPLRARLGGPALAALLALLAIGVWTAISILWTPVRDAAPADAQRAFLYAALFASGLWTCNLLGRRIAAALLPVAVGGVLVGVVTVVTLAFGTDFASYFHGDATLRFPIGYRNANATFFLICAWPLLALATGERGAWPLRALAIGSVTMLVELLVLAQSRGSLPAAIVALLVYLVLAPNRLRASAYLAVALIPVLPALPILLDVFQHSQADRAIIPVLHEAARAIALTSVLSVALAAIVARGVEPRVRLSPSTSRRLARSLAAVALVCVAIGGGVFVAERGGPVSFLNQRVDEFKSGGSPNLSRFGTRFGVNVGSNRDDFWRVALDQGEAHPLLGGGAGAFQFFYIEHRRSPETPQDPHSAELLMLSELGIPGLTAFAIFVIAAGFAGVRSRSRVPVAGTLVAGSLAAGANWVVHSSYDWFWHFPALTAMAIYLLGAAAAPALFDSRAELGRRVRIGAGAALAVLAILAIPLYLSERYTVRASEEWRSDPSRAYEDLDRAKDSNPWDAGPLLIKGVIASQVGDRAVAVSAFREAADREPDNYATHYFLARQLARRDPAGAARELALARELNPIGADVRQLTRKLERQVPRRRQ